MAIAAGVRLQTGRTALASPMCEVAPTICASSTTASWVQVSAVAKRAYPSSSARTARRIVESASEWNGVTPTPTLESGSAAFPVA
jgi:hypothetical protein